MEGHTVNTGAIPLLVHTVGTILSWVFGIIGITAVIPWLQVVFITLGIVISAGNIILMWPKIKKLFRGEG